MPARRQEIVLALFASLAAHVVAMSTLGLTPSVESTRADVRERVWLETAMSFDGEGVVDMRAQVSLEMATRVPRVLPGGPEPEQNVDTQTRGGASEPAASRAIALVTRADTLTLSRLSPNAASESQLSRIRTDRARTTPWQGRSTPSPGEATFIASGAGHHGERRVPSPHMPRAGARTTRAPSIETTGAVEARTDPHTLGTSEPTPSDARARAQATRTQPAAGVNEGEGTRASTRADVAHARPPLTPGLPTLPAPTIYELPRDRVDSEALSAARRVSFVDRSHRGARETGEGAGGGAPPHEGGRSHALSPGPGRASVLDIAEGRYRPFYVALQREVERHLTYPRARARNLDQGLAVFRVSLHRDGRLARAPVLVRTTGFDDLDAVSRHAIERARFTRLPEDLAPEQPIVTIRLSVHSRNPTVR